MVSISEIDSERFGFPIARDPLFTASTLEATVRACRDGGTKMLIARCDVADVAAAQAMEAVGGRIMDTLVYYVRDLDEGVPEVAGGRTRLLQPGDENGVRGVAVEAFKNYIGHYHADPRLEKAKCDEAYASWAERSCSDQTVASSVLVAECQGEIAGFLTLQRRGRDEQEIILNAVHPAHQRIGLYRQLVLHAMSLARDGGAARLSVSTQLANVGVQRVWGRAGFAPRQSFYTFHLWF